MKRLRIPIFLTCCLAAACLISMRIEGNPLPPFEKRKKMALDLLPDVLFSHLNDEVIALLLDGDFDLNTMEWIAPTPLEVDIYPSFGQLDPMPGPCFTADQLQRRSPDLMMIVCSEEKLLNTLLIRYDPETGQSRAIQGGYGSKWVQGFYDQLEVFKQIKTKNSPICIVNHRYKSYIYGNTIYGKNMLLDINPEPGELEVPYFQHQDTGGIPLIELEDLEPMLLGWEDSIQYLGAHRTFAEFLPEYPHSAVVRERWSVGIAIAAAGVLLSAGLIGWLMYRSKQRTKKSQAEQVKDWGIQRHG